MDFLSRRKFLNYTLLSSAVFIMNGCKLVSVVTPLQTMKLIWEDLFPHAKTLGIKSSLYLTLILNHSHITNEDKEFLKNGVKWLNEDALKVYQNTYTKLTSKQRESLLEQISQKKWGKNWLAKLMSYGFEAMLSDPVYGSNLNEESWKWLAFEGGKPRPKRAFV